MILKNAHVRKISYEQILESVISVKNAKKNLFIAGPKLLRNHSLSWVFSTKNWFRTEQDSLTVYKTISKQSEIYIKLKILF